MKALLIALTLGYVGLLQQKPKVTIFMAGDSTMSVKETKFYPETGWGMPFQYFWDSTVQVVNKAKNGRSSKTFITEGLWAQIMQAGKSGDYVLIQFGHNDEAKEKVERYTKPEEYKQNLQRMVREARAKGMRPLLLTPVGRRKFDPSGKVMPTHSVYTPLVKEVAIQDTVLLIDADAHSQSLYQQMGPEYSKLLFLQLKPGEHPNYPEGKEDNTHFSELGARLVAQQIFREILVQFPELATRVVRPVKKP
jgi:lysophospholipase L1-like esterase